MIIINNNKITPKLNINNNREPTKGLIKTIIKVIRYKMFLKDY